MDKNQINMVHQLKIRDEDVCITPTAGGVNGGSGGDDEKEEGYSWNARSMAAKTSYPMNTAFNVTLEWKALAPLLRAREDTAMCLFSDKNISWKVCLSALCGDILWVLKYRKLIGGLSLCLCSRTVPGNE